MSYTATGSQEGSGHGGARALDRLLHLSSLDDKWTVEYIWLGAVFSRRPARRASFSLGRSLPVVGGPPLARPPRLRETLSRNARQRPRAQAATTATCAERRGRWRVRYARYRTSRRGTTTARARTKPRQRSHARSEESLPRPVPRVLPVRDDHPRRQHAPAALDGDPPRRARRAGARGDRARRRRRRGKRGGRRVAERAADARRRRLRRLRVSGAFYTLVPIRPRQRGERRSLRTFPGASLRPPPAFNPLPRRLSTPTDAFQLHPDFRLYRTALSRRRPTETTSPRDASPGSPRTSTSTLASSGGSRSLPGTGTVTRSRARPCSGNAASSSCCAIATSRRRERLLRPTRARERRGSSSTRTSRARSLGSG